MRHRAPTDLLFIEVDSFSVQDHQRKAVESEIVNMDGNRLLNTNVDDLVGYVVEKYRVDVPELDEANMSVDQQEARRDVSGDPRRMAYFMDSGPVHVTGTEVIVDVPFSGDPAMFKVRPNQYDTMPPRGEVRDNIITFRYWNDTPQTEQVRSELDRWLADVKRYLQWQYESFRGFNDGLANLARTAITRRRDKAHQAQLIVGAFPQGRSSGAGLPEMNEISLPLLDKWRCSISLSGSGEEDFFKHDRVSISMETRSCRQLPVGRLC